MRLLSAVAVLFLFLLSPLPVFGASTDGTRVPPSSEIIDGSNNVWTISENKIMKNGVHAASGYGSIITWCDTKVRVYGNNNAWWLWNEGWVLLTTVDPCSTTQPTTQTTQTTTTSTVLPTVTISASPTSVSTGQSSTLTWSSTNATSCVLSGGYTATVGTSGTQVVTPSSSGANYNISCTGSGGSANATAIVTNSGTVTTQSATPTFGTLCYDLTADCVILQSETMDTGLYPAGVPTYYNWYDGGGFGARAAPANFTSFTSWGVVYPQVGQANVSANVYLKGAKTYVHKKSGGWLLVQNQGSGFGLGGGHYVADFAGNAAIPMTITTTGGAGGEVRFVTPPTGRNDHFWPTPRSSYPANTVDYVFLIAEMKVDNPSGNFVAQLGGDWWVTPSAPYTEPVGSSNPAVGSTNWLKLSSDYKNFMFSSAPKSLLLSDPPPPLVGTQGTQTTSTTQTPQTTPTTVATSTQTQSGPAPIVSVSATPSYVSVGQSSTLAWASTNATSCSISGGYTAANLGTSGTQVVTPSASGATYTITCTGTGGSANTTATVLSVNSSILKLAVHDRVQVTNGPVNVRQSANTAGTLLGTQSNGTLGTVVSGPVTQGGFNWWNINYDSGADGWSVEDFMTKVVTTVQQQTPTTTQTTATTTTTNTTPQTTSGSSNTSNTSGGSSGGGGGGSAPSSAGQGGSAVQQSSGGGSSTGSGGGGAGQTNNPTKASYAFSKDLEVGARGEDVRELQKFLNAGGYSVAVSGDGSAGSETTYFGLATQAALAKYQAANGISPAGGYFGPKTRKVLLGTSTSLLQSTATSTTLTNASSFTRNLKVGDRGEDVRELQRFLNAHGYLVTTSGDGSQGSETTYFGPATRSALAKYQAANGIVPAEGYFGPLTRAYVTTH